MATDDTQVTAMTDREMVGTRTSDAPGELVFGAITDPDQIGQWWGPPGFTTTTQSFDLRPGAGVVEGHPDTGAAGRVPGPAIASRRER